MKKLFLKSLTIVAVATSLIACKQNKKAETTAAKEVKAPPVVSELYTANAAKTLITWNAKKLVGGHEGTINASNGNLNVKGGKVVGGTFLFDINTITATDIDASGGLEKLNGHLKNEDFFDVGNYPNAAFQITGVKANGAKSLVSGNLTIKDVKKNIEFPATISVANGIATITSDEFVIDRTEFNIKYNSGKFADAAKLGDYLIKDKVGIKVQVVANK